ncbi:MAG: DUF1273 family protein [Clostridia bacterium]|nr:DUF1273 family protein [Clostridia bacterium]
MRGCCFTGHRPEKCSFKYDKRCGEFVVLADELENQIIAAINDGFDTFYCGGAKGFDLLAAEILVSLREKYKIKIILVIPFEGQEKGFSAEWKRRYKYALDAADERICLSDEYYRGCYNARNRYMVDHSERVVAHYDGSPGGTRDTVNYAKQQGKTVINVAERLKMMFQFSLLD